MLQFIAAMRKATRKRSCAFERNELWKIQFARQSTNSSRNITTSRKLANLKQNPRVGIFIGPSQPSAWFEATALARILTDESASSVVLENLGEKSSVAAAFIARVPIVAVEMQIKWLRITNLAASPLYTEVTFDTVASGQG